jgi:hypothetical protein
MESVTHQDFWDCYRRLPVEIRQAARDAYQLFATNPQHPSLQFHRLKWDPEFWSVRVTRDYRAVGCLQGRVMTWVWIGTHQEFDKAFPR